MFDSYQAAKQLGLSRLSLSFLMHHYCGIDVNKHFQLADWRIRPLPENLLNYAREDTHYLPYIYDTMKNLLIQQGNGNTNILESVLQCSTNVCKKRYVKPVLEPDSHLEMHRKSKRLFNNRQLFALKEFYHWRDKIARQEDESTGYVLPNHMLLQISELLPREMQGILACCNPIPPLVRQNLVFLHQIALKAREQPIIKPILEEELRTRNTTQQCGTVDTDGPLHCPHDLSHLTEFRDDLPTLLGSGFEENAERNVRKDVVTPLIECAISSPKPKLAIFDTPDNSEYYGEQSEVLSKLKHVKFVSPYDRYKLVRPYTASVEKKLLEEKPVEPVELSNVENEASIERVKKHFQDVVASTPSAPAMNKLSFSIQGPYSSHSVTATTQSPQKEEEPQSIRKQIHNKKRKRNMSADSINKNRKVMDNNFKIPEVSRNPQENKFLNDQKHKNKNDDDTTDTTVEHSIPSNSNSNQSQQQVNISPQNARNKNTMKRNNSNSRDPEQNRNNTNFDAFNYGNVDFKKFRGGSAQAPKSNQVATKFKGKNKNNMYNGKSNNKVFSFNQKGSSKKK